VQKTRKFEDMDKLNPPGPAILLVDDNPQNLQVLANLLQEEKYGIEFALNGKAAVDWLRNRQFDLVLLDINMPVMNGFEVCKKIRSEKTMSGIPIIFLSAESERESILKGFEVGAQDFVIKPFDSRELLARVKTQLDLKSKTEKLEKVNDWLGKKIENWLKVSVGFQKSGESNDLNDKMIEFDKNRGFVLNDICLDLCTSIKEIVKLIGKSNDQKIKREFEEIKKRMNDSVVKLKKCKNNG
jgi:two-component system, sensor histidine kinase and response regulator